MHCIHNRNISRRAKNINKNYIIHSNTKNSLPKATKTKNLLDNNKENPTQSEKILKMLFSFNTKML